MKERGGRKRGAQYERKRGEKEREQVGVGEYERKRGQRESTI